MDPDAVAKAFVEHYYRTFDGNRAALGSLYQDASMLTFEGDKIQGAAAIVAKLTSLPFQQCAHAISTVDCQPSGPAGGVLVFVSGSLQLAGESHTLKFSQLDSVLSNMRKSPKIAEKMIQASAKKSNCKKTKVGWGVPPSFSDSQD